METRISEILMWPVMGYRVFRHRGRRYRLGPAAVETLDVLREITANPACQSITGLMRMRPRLRELLANPAPITLCCCIDRASDPRTLRVAIWLLGRIGNTYATPSVAPHAYHASFRVRREAVRALHRLHAWSELRRIREQHSDPATRSLAVQSKPSPYQDRLDAFVHQVETLPASATHQPLVLADDLEVDGGRPPRSPWQIGYVLRRIRRLVRGRHGGWRRLLKTRRRVRSVVAHR